ncbi:putative basic amino acid antiporter YfcC [Sedimentibacter hydroxybenzoicus DSM 7310]|uniref:Basic amino acid antiporter YfcC n=1 Tax=Sedimentibacter hydroxybenzoicus DSM 7310 TaxID=1123245 RepID=A0A974GUV1_SEDHY|nr:YfcC family protein [Sedimentibacter hydroxybenzoicus]NYB72711.1 putative basic amino acid antiporter YfcC [Sedimentibacter hydroxybenzoicus DSM 7310]
MEKSIEKKKRFRIPHTYALLFFVIVLVAVLTYVIPAGEFDRAVDPETDRIFVVPDTYHSVESNPLSFFDVFKAIPKGMENSGYIIFFVLMIGGSFGILQSTGAIDSGIVEVVKRMKGKEKAVIPIVMFIFSLAGAILGSAEEMLPFYPIVISLALALGFDTLTGTAMVLLGAGAGFAGAFLNPFTVGIAQGIAGLPMFSGIGFRLIAYVLILSITIIYVYRYASKIQKNPELSVTYEEDKIRHKEFEFNDNIEFTTRHKIVMLILISGLCILGYGVVELNFYITELTAIFLIIGILSGVAGGLSIDKIAQEFINGAKELVYGALVIGLATSIMVVMQEGKIMDTIIYSLAGLVQGLPPSLSGVAMFIVQSFINFIIPSGSGQAAASMPIMAPMADLVGISRQSAVLAFQFGDGFSNVINPTSGYFMAAIAIGGIRWEKWAKWMLPLLLIWSLIGAILVAVSVMIGYGPF